jgi:hypothetical protein
MPIYLTLIISALFYQLAFAKEIPPEYQATKFEDIKRFENLPGGTYVLGYGIDPKSNKLVPLAVYDKTFAGPLNTRFWQNLFLSMVGINDLNLSNLKNSVSKKWKKKQKRKFISQLASSLNLEEHEDSNLKEKYPCYWWKNPNIKWKKNHKPNMHGPAPEKIYLSSIEFNEIFKQKKRYGKFKKIFSKFIQILEDDLNSKDVDKKIDEIGGSGSYFKKNKDNTYSLYVISQEKSMPIKVIDLRGKDTSFKKALSWSASTNILKIGVSHIPIYGLAQVMVAMLERLFNLVEVAYLVHHGRALNNILEALDGNPKSPFFEKLNQEQLCDSIRYLKRSNTLISGMMSSAVIKKEKLGKRYWEKILERKQKSISYLQRKGFKIYPFDKSVYAVGVRKSEQGIIKEFKIFSLIRGKTLRKKPHDIMDYIHPHKEHVRRNMLEAGLFLSNFFTIPVPLLGTAFKTLYKELAIRQVHRYQMQEFGFITRLHHNEAELRNILLKTGIAEEDLDSFVEDTYKQLFNRMLNPILLNEKQMQRHIKKVDLTLKKVDSTYQMNAT